MTKFHVNPATGNAGKCRADNNCPFGDIDKDHYPTVEQARKAFEDRMMADHSPAKLYPDYSKDDSMQIASTIKQQVGVGTLMSLGASDFVAIKGGLRFNARILPFNEDGKRSSRPAKMIVEVKLNGLDYYDVKVHRIRGFNSELHFKAEDIDAQSISGTLFSLDYDGPTVQNPRI